MNSTKRKSSEYKGVSKNGTDKYIAYIQKDSIHHHLGTFNSSEEAALAYDLKAKELFGEFAKPNFK